jgi:hypothetical protein
MMLKRHSFSLPLGVILAAAAIVGCGSPTSGDKKQAAPVSSSAQPLRPDGDTERLAGEPVKIDFQLRITQPLVGHVVATRTLARQGLETLGSRIEWDIRIEPSDEGLRISSQGPEVGRLQARLPEDALNQLLIGRMFLPSGVLGNDGTFHGAAGTRESVEDLHDALSSASSPLLRGEDVRQFLANALSENTVETTCREHWKTMIQSFMGKTMEVGVTYETEAPTDLPLGGAVVFVSKLKVISQEPCTSGQSEHKCVRIEWRSQPKDPLIDEIQKSAANRIPAAASFESFDMTIDMAQVVDPSTLVPHSLMIVKKTEADVRLSNGAVAPLREASTEKWQYVWEDHVPAQSN